MKEVFHKLWWHSESRDDGAVVQQPKFYWPHIFHQCGHTGSVTYRIIAHKRVFKDTDLGLTYRGLCPDCAANEFLHAVINCVQCAQPIFPGQPVAVASAELNDHRKPGVHFMNRGKDTVICCGINCHNGDPAGRWNGEEIEKAK